MRLIFSSLVVFIVLINLSVQSTSAQVPTLSMMIPGQNCGMASTPNDKCCSFDPVKVPSLPAVNAVGASTVMNIISSLVNNALNPVFTPINQLVQQTIQPCVQGAPSTPGDPTDRSCKCVEPTGSPLLVMKHLCNNIDAKNVKEKDECVKCLLGSGGNVGVWTGIGCVYTDLDSFVTNTLLGWGVRLAGLMSLLCMIYAAFQMQTSGGNPEKIKKAQELLTSCIMGLMLIIFSIFILRLIGVDILRIPGFLGK